MKKLTFGKLFWIIIITTSFINHRVYVNMYEESPFFHEPLDHGIYTFITGIMFALSLLSILGLIISLIIDYWNKPIN